MDQGLDAEQQIEQLKAELQRKRLELEESKRAEQLLQLRLRHQSAFLGQSQLSQSSSQNNVDVPSPVFNEHYLPSTPHSASFFDMQDQDALSQVPRRNTVPRSVGHVTTATAANDAAVNAPPPSAIRRGNDVPQSVKRQRTMSQQVPESHLHSHSHSQKMGRSLSSLSTRSAGATLFNGNGTVTPPPRTNVRMMDYMSKDEPVSSYAFGHTMSRSQSSRARPRPDMGQSMPTVAESASMHMMDPRLRDPDEFISTLPPDDLSGTDYGLCSGPPISMTMPMSMPVQQHPDFDISHCNVADVSVCGSMTSAPTLETAPMTRQNSSIENQSVTGPFDMMNIRLQQGMNISPHHDSPSRLYMGGDDNSPSGKCASRSENDLIAVGCSPEFLEAPDMQRSGSNLSMSSTKSSSSSSLKIRLNQTLRDQIHRSSSTTLKPKPLVDDRDAEPQHSKKDGKTPITKTKYVRPRQPKVFCTHCTDHPEGFRGEHELRRHCSAKHPQQGFVKKWICIDPTNDPLFSGTRAINPLDKCKACNNKKLYGAYYNAAAHLRRTHFKEKPSRAKNKNGSSHAHGGEDRRGGKGGGDWPPMQELRNWMREVQAHANEDDDDDVEDESVSNNTMELDFPVAGPDSFRDIGTVHDYSDLDPHSEFADLDYGSFHSTNGLVIDTDIPIHMNGNMPLSSANFDFSPSPMGHSLSGSYGSSGGHGLVNLYGSVGSGSETIISMHGLSAEPLSADGALGELQFNDMYPQ